MGFLRHAEHCPESVIVTDRDGRIEYVNAACERVTGYARQELVGRTPALLKSGILVREGAGVGFPGHLRISIGTAEDNTRLLDVWDRTVIGG